MTNGVNKVILVGRLGDNPEFRATAKGRSVANVSLATNESWHDKETGKKSERTEWHKLVFWDNHADNVCKFCKKGDQLYIEGSLYTDKHVREDGITLSYTKVRVLGWLNLTPKDESHKAPPSPQQTYSEASAGTRQRAIPTSAPSSQPPPPQSQQQSQQPLIEQNQVDFDDDIPF